MILGHAPHVVLGDRLDTLKVLISGSRDGGTRRVMAGMGVDEKTARKTGERTSGVRGERYRHSTTDSGLSALTIAIRVGVPCCYAGHRQRKRAWAVTSLEATALVAVRVHFGFHVWRGCGSA